MRKIQLILHATDFSANAQHGLELACDLAKAHEARLIVLHVVPLFTPQWAGRDAEWELRRLDCGTIQPERMLTGGDPGSEIISAARRLNADLIVLGQPQPSWWRWLVEERAAQTVVRTAACPVLIATDPKASTAASHSARGQAITTGRRFHFPQEDREWNPNDGASRLARGQMQRLVRLHPHKSKKMAGSSKTPERA